MLGVALAVVKDGGALPAALLIGVEFAQVSDDLLPRPGLGALALDQREVGVLRPRLVRVSRRRNMPPLPEIAENQPGDRLRTKFPLHRVSDANLQNPSRIRAGKVENQRFWPGSAQDGLTGGTILMNWFTLEKNQVAILLARSTDNGKTWSKPVRLKLDSSYSFACSSPVRQLADGSLILGLYCEVEKTKKAFGATVKSYDSGTTWTDLAYIGEKADIYLDAETDVVSLKSGKLLAALRSSKVDMHYAVSGDSGKTWGPVKSFGFKGHCPYFLRIAAA